ncbi:protein OSCP1 [Episyrphus balteatus]|uniref:protein OSCP1 n=1 Tax=Episyrphus balteatus TaxID=286459 RepID=UPI002485F25B|nr:protein OSCP1 [Episyrphus balteatus]
MTPEANVFLVVNLGCEMLYVIDQRLKAQKISPEKSAEVMRDITSVLLDPKLVERLIIGSQQQKSLITAEHCKFMLGDIACCSLMRLDDGSMGKLWNLMTMIFKWQMFVTKHPQHLLDVTFRHLDGLGKMHPEVKKSILVDYTKNTILDFWNSNTETIQLGIYKTIKSWLECFNVKISLLLRLGFQAMDSSFYKDPKESFFEEFSDQTGDNIYMKSMEIAAALKEEQGKTQGNPIDNLQTQLNVVGSDSEGPKKNTFFDDVQLEVEATPSSKDVSSTFVQLKPIHNPLNSSWENFVAHRSAQRADGGEKKLRTLLPKST